MKELSYENALTAENVRPNESLVSLANDIVHRVPGCPDVTVRLTLQSVWREFCRKTGVMRFAVRGAASPVRSVYHIVLPVEASVMQVEGAMLVNDAGRNVRDLVWNVDYTVKQGSPPSIVLEKTVSNGDCMKGSHIVAVVTCAPVRNSEDVPCGMLDAYGDAIVHGSLFKLFSMSNRSWTDQQQAVIEAREYEHAMNEAAIDANGGGRLYATNPIGWA